LTFYIISANISKIRRLIKRFYVSKIVVILVSLAIGFVAGLLVEGRKKAPAKRVTKIEEE
jgi:hypothetical protein